MVACVITGIHKETPRLMVGMATRAIEDDDDDDDDDDSLLTTTTGGYQRAYDIYDADRNGDAKVRTRVMTIGMPIMVVPRWWWWWWWWWWGVGFKVACHTSPPPPPAHDSCM